MDLKGIFKVSLVFLAIIIVFSLSLCGILETDKWRLQSKKNIARIKL